MARERDPRREQAFEIWKKSDGKMKLKEIAEQLGISEGTVRGWKNKDSWVDKLNGTFQKNERNVPKKSKERSNKKRGAPKGNKNAVGNNGGAPKGNKNAVGHGAPLRNENAVRTGEYKSLWMDALDDDEKEMLNQIEDIDPINEIMDAIKLYTYRERFIMMRIKALTEGMDSTQIRRLQERRKVKEKVNVEDLEKGGFKVLEREEYKLVTTAIEENIADPVEQVLAHQEALTRIQDKKVKANEALFKLTNEFDLKKEINTIKATILQEKWDKEKGADNNQQQQSEDWVAGLQNVFEKRKAKRREL